MSEPAGFDRDAVRARLRDPSDATAADLRSADALESLYKKRAVLLAQAQRSGKEEGEEIVIFRLRNERYALPLKRVAGAIARAVVAPVPGGPAEIAGLIHARGEIRVVWNPARILGLPEPGPDDEQPQAVLLVGGADGEQGILVDELEDIQTIDHAAKRPVPAQRTQAAWMTESLVIVLDPDKLLPGTTEESSEE